MLLGFAHFGAVLTLAFAVIGAVLESAAVGRGFQFGTFGMCDAAGCGHGVWPWRARCMFRRSAIKYFLFACPSCPRLCLPTPACIITTLQ